MKFPLSLYSTNKLTQLEFVVEVIGMSPTIQNSCCNSAQELK